MSEDLMATEGQHLPWVLKVFTKLLNAGDQFNFALAHHYLPDPVIPSGAAPVGRPNLMVLGSILQWADVHTIVCGAGFVSADARLSALPRAVLLVRGPLSVASLERQGWTDASRLPCADPGVLAARLYPDNTTPDIPFAVIPHYVDLEAPQLGTVTADGGVVINPLQPLDSYFDLLRRSRAILSSTLHGLIFAHAYGKPALWLQFSDRVLGAGFKFFDYYQSLSVTPEAVPFWKVAPEQRLAHLLVHARPHHNGALIPRVEEALATAVEQWQ